MSITHSLSNLNSVTSEEFLPPVNRWIILSGLILAGTIATAIGFSSVTQYNIIVKAPAVVQPIGKIRLVESETEGTVRQILVKENQTVRRGDVIAYLDDTQLQTKKSQLHSSVQQNQLQLIQLDAQVRSLNTQIQAESTSNQAILTSANAELKQAQQEYRDRTLTAQADVQEAKAALDLAQDELNRYTQLMADGAVSTMEFNQKESGVKSSKAKLSRVTVGLEPSEATVAIAQAQIAQQRAKGESTLAALQKERQALIQQEVQIQAQLQQNQQDLQQTEHDWQRTIVQASGNGIILQLNLHNAGQVVHTGDTIAQISPNDAPLVIEATVANQDIQKIALEQQVQLRVTACPYPDYGILVGKIKAISPDVVTTQNANSTPSVVPLSQGNHPEGAAPFAVMIQPESLSLTHGKQECLVQAGMQAEADIISKKETILQFILRKARILTDL
jgi:HlyD family secretion protein